MFRGQQNPFDDVIAKATDENLTSENWEVMMDAWEKINEKPETGPRDAVSALIKRLAHRNANVQLYTLELANAFSQNCGSKMHRELASKTFTDALLRLANDRTTHGQVKGKILERMEEWVNMFKSDPSLGIMDQAYQKLKQTNPNLHAPSKPQKQQITDVDRQREEEELAMALEISLRDKGTNAAQASSSQSQQTTQQNQYQRQNSVQEQTPPAPAPTHQTAATVSRVRALYDFTPTEQGELAFKKGDVIAVLESVYKDWWKGSLRGGTGIFPLNYVEKLSDPTPEEIQREAQMEAEVFAEIKNVEKLLSLLSSSAGHDNDVQSNEEITKLYHQTLSIRPKLIELIAKYSQKKDDFMSLNEKFIKARRDYEALLETSMAQSPASYGGRPGYGYPPPGQQYGAPPQQGTPGPGRYFSPGPNNGPAPGPGRTSAAGFHTPGPESRIPGQPPYPQGNAGQPPRRNTSGPYPHFGGPETGPQDPNAAPFYMVGNQGGQPQQRPPSAHKTSPRLQQQPYQRPPTADAHLPPQQQQQYPPDGSTPQELATAQYDTPTSDHNPYSNSTSQRPISPSHPPGQPAYTSFYNYNAQQQPLQQQIPVSPQAHQSELHLSHPPPVSPSSPYSAVPNLTFTSPTTTGSSTNTRPPGSFVGPGYEQGRPQSFYGGGGPPQHAPPAVPGAGGPGWGYQQ